MVRLSMVLAAIVLALGPALARDKPRVVAVNYPLQYFAERLLGDAAEVVYPVPQGIDPSFWRPSVADISAIQSADLILLNGAGFATWTTKVSLPRSKLVDTSRGLQESFIATESITHSHGDGGEHSHEGTASYTWLDPALAKAQARSIADAITARGMADAGAVGPRMDALLADLDALEARARETLRETAGTVFIATHPRYQYLGRAYDLRILALEWDAGAMPDDDELAALARLAGESGATVLIWEAEPPAAALDAAAALGLENVVFPPLAVPPPGKTLPESLAASIEALAAAALRAKSG